MSMKDDELETLLKDLESDRVERKASISDRSKIRQAICAFANDLPNYQQPGILFIGVDDDGNCANLPITDELLRTLSDMRSDGNILPFPSLIVQKRILLGCELAVIIVKPSYSPPVRYDGRVWIRVGPRRATATVEEETRLSEKRRSKDLPYDIQPISMANLKDLDLSLFEEYLLASLPIEVIEENQRTMEQKLSSVRFATAINHQVNSSIFPTNLGLLVIGKDPREYISGDYIQFLRIDGTELGDPIQDQKEINGPISLILRILDEIFQAHISVATDLTSDIIEIQKPDYPLVALRQLGINAILHRNYETSHAPVMIYWFNDRIEIHNPGGLYGQVTRENFDKGGITDYRNPNLAEALKNLGYVQKFGYGIPLAKKKLQKNGNPEPEFLIEDSHICVIIRRAV